MAETFGGTRGVRFERALLWLTINDAAFAERALAALNAEFFHRESHRDIALAIHELRNANGAPPSPLMLETHLRNRLSQTQADTPTHERRRNATIALQKIQRHARIRNADERLYVERHVREFVTRAAVFNAIYDGTQDWKDGNYDAVWAKIDAAYRYADTHVQHNLGIDFRDHAAKLERYRKQMRHTAGCPIGLPRMDSAMRGGLENGALGIFAGPSGRGKSMCLVCAGAAALLHGRNVVHITLELSDTDVSLRYDARLTGIHINTLLKNPSAHANAVVAATRKATGRLFIRQWAPREATVRDIIAYIRAVERRYELGIDAIVVDYLDELAPPDTTKEYRFQLIDLSTALKRLAVRENVAVWTASQTKGQSFDRHVLKLNDVSECINKIQIADIVIGICQTAGERKRNNMRLALLKNRQGGAEHTIVDCSVNTATQSIQERRTPGSIPDAAQ